MTPDWAGVARGLIEHWERLGFASHDPYDGLASGWLRSGARLPRPARHALVQAVKRLPFNVRGALRIPRMRNSYAEAHFASASISLWMLSGDDEDLRRARAHLEWLDTNRVGGGWAYPFDVQTRTGSYARSTPNVICTAFAARAFAEMAEATGDAAAGDAAVGAARFMADRLLRRKAGATWFAYVPGHGAVIHNANLLAARAAVWAGAHGGDPDLTDSGRSAALLSASAVSRSGAVPYGDRPPYRWVDGHHTGFVVETLTDVSAFVPEVRDAAERAARFYRDRLFAPDGRPYPAPGRANPVDTIAGAQGILTFAKRGDLQTARRVGAWMLSNMRAGDGTFVFQRGRMHVKRVPYARWSDAPMAVALAALALRETAA